jgi:hypothetical protein
LKKPTGRHPFDLPSSRLKEQDERRASERRDRSRTSRRKTTDVVQDARDAGDPIAIERIDGPLTAQEALAEYRQHAKQQLDYVLKHGTKKPRSHRLPAGTRLARFGQKPEEWVAPTGRPRTEEQKKAARNRIALRHGRRVETIRDAGKRLPPFKGCELALYRRAKRRAGRGATAHQIAEWMGLIEIKDTTGDTLKPRAYRLIRNAAKNSRL